MIPEPQWLRALSWVRTNAAQYQLDPHKIGMMGFSSGATVAASVGFSFQPVSRQDFLAPIYLVYRWVDRTVP